MPPTILICDDEAGILRYLDKLLAGTGLRVETFGAGTELLTRIEAGESGDADLLLQDVKMPDMDGIDVLRRVRELRPGLLCVVRRRKFIAAKTTSRPLPAGRSKSWKGPAGDRWPGLGPRHPLGHVEFL